MGEVERGCGWRVAHGLYACGVGLGVLCDRLPLNIESCPTCGAGLKVTRMPMRVDFKTMYGKHMAKLVPVSTGLALTGQPQYVTVENCSEIEKCPVCNPDLMRGTVYLLGVGREYTTQSFIEEARRLGVSKRIWVIPKDLEVGKTWILLTHRDAGTKTFPMHEWNHPNSGAKCVHCGKNWFIGEGPECVRKVPAIFYAYQPERIEYLIWRSEATPENIESLEKRGLTVVIIEDGNEKHMAGKSKLPKLKEPKLKEPPKPKGQTPDEFTKTLG